MAIAIWNTHTESIHFPTAYQTIEEAANDVAQHLSEAPYEYGNLTILELMDVDLDNPSPSNITLLARIDIRQNAWLHIRDKDATIHMVLPKRRWKKPLPSLRSIVIWNFTGRTRMFDEHPTVHAALDAIAHVAHSYDSDTTFGLFESADLERLRDEHGSAIPESCTSLIVVIEKKAWVSYKCDGFKHRILLPISKRTIKRRAHKKPP